MEIILVTPNPKYESLFSSTKMYMCIISRIESNTVDIVSIIQKQVFLNRHYNISFYCIKNNFPYQFHCPLKISKHLLDRNQGPVQIYISNGLYFKIQADTDTLQILSNIQNSLQGAQSEQNVIFTLKYWEKQIKMIILNQTLQQNKIKQTISAIQIYTSSTSTYFGPYSSHQVSKLLLYIDQNNYQQFLSWSDGEGLLCDFQQNQKLSNQYMKIKQEIDNEKNSFRNKIRMVQTILGQNINIDKLLNEQKQQNQEYKRLRQTFETIKNIDNVLIQQQKKLEQRSNQYKSKRSQKHRLHYQNAQNYAKKKNQISELIKQIDQLKYKIDCVSSDKAKYQSRRNFESGPKIKSLLIQQVNRCKNIFRNVSSFQVGHKKNSTSKNNESIMEHQKMVNKPRIIQSLYKNQKKQLQKYQHLLKSRVNQLKKLKKQEDKLIQSKSEKIDEQTVKYCNVLLGIYNFYEKNNSLLCELRKKVHQNNKINKNYRQNGSNFNSFMGDNTSFNHSILLQKSIVIKNKTKINSLHSSNLADHNNTNYSSLVEKQQSSLMDMFQPQFIVLGQLLSNKSPFAGMVIKQNKEITSNKIQSNASINQKFTYGGVIQDQKQKEKDRQRQKQRENSLSMKLQNLHLFSQTNQRLKQGFQKKLKKNKLQKMINVNPGCR